MRLFLVFMEGNYRHDLISVSRAEADAHRNAQRAMDAESDGYHSFRVYRVDTNKALTYLRSERFSATGGWDRPVLIGSYTQQVFATQPRRVRYQEAT